MQVLKGKGNHTEKITQNLILDHTKIWETKILIDTCHTLCIGPSSGLAKFGLFCRYFQNVDGPPLSYSVLLALKVQTGLTQIVEFLLKVWMFLLFVCFCSGRLVETRATQRARE